ncbi:MAG: hypothetical protein EOP33_00950 [Rickettsiaceae bacterium]|nr:MAG: hypothetical protein EOP33_00950 [Rickettsiaceae bacterium]
MILYSISSNIVKSGTKKDFENHIDHYVKYYDLKPALVVDVVTAAPTEPSTLQDDNVKKAYGIYMSESGSPLKAGNPSAALEKTGKVAALLNKSCTSTLEQGQYDQGLIDMLLGYDLDRIVGSEAKQKLAAEKDFAIQYYNLTPAPSPEAQEANLTGQPSTLDEINQ